MDINVLLPKRAHFGFMKSNVDWSLFWFTIGIFLSLFTFCKTQQPIRSSSYVSFSSKHWAKLVFFVILGNYLFVCKINWDAFSDYIYLIPYTYIPDLQLQLGFRKTAKNYCHWFDLPDENTASCISANFFWEI